MTTTLEYLMTFRKCSSLDSLERVYDKLHYSIDNDTEMGSMYRAADHRRAELVSGKLFDLGKIPKTLWARVL
ncbi:TPA: oriC-binding nucleoid-associated protein [Serratia rubidaea]|uniref:Hha/YmoA family nucleoid-associated regulatory protein n=1 Tax=Serratia rubidaea TaxID=61652 RepID=UPI0023B1C0BD|nr:Hha/YmoA family nucleoid-associated regulatory protein [Serratia rubidaea]MDK1702625.1 Hha/YmoA family nucleoid-associated regulatory protein [Serratia rubidaea]HDJ1441780.1 oriC-binding nucleoid-associated protein [Serratia rubidaea]HDJ1448470.1 oriC-binding nucleoid-associated protein [Serratia rubidaea]HDJ1463434.1 oriC-binding nucleoid-associated protein [Serratia rubidaea]HDJ2772182.1 oriC-binding nucleoid-associated protein [Serratia rubidaea]